MNDRDLIGRLVEDLSPSRRLPAPSLRAGTWALLSACYVMLAIGVLGPRHDVTRMLARTTSLTEATALVVASCCGALWAFHRAIPGAASRFAQVAACGAAMTWAFAVASSWAAPHWLIGWRCVARMAIAGALPAVLGVVMLGRAGCAAARSYRLVVVPAGALAMVATQLVCAKDGVDHVLVWHAGPLAVAFAVGMLFA